MKQSEKSALIDAVKQDKTAPLRLDVHNLATVQPETVTWLWYPYIPLGKVTMLDGDPGSGKSWLTLSLAATLSTGAPWYGTTEKRKPARTLLIGAEDGLADTIVPRLTMMGSDLSWIEAVQITKDAANGDRTVDLTKDLPLIRQYVAEVHPLLLVVDPVQAHVAASDLNSASAVRSILTPMALLAEREGMAVLIVRHLRKSESTNALYRGSGSIDFAGAARSVLLVARDRQSETNRRVVLPLKNSLGPEGDALTFVITDQGLLWQGTDASITQDSLLAPIPVKIHSKIDEAMDFLQDRLGDGPICQTTLVREADEMGIKEPTLRRAKKELAVKTSKSAKEWVWSLPRQASVDHLDQVDAKSSAATVSDPQSRRSHHDHLDQVDKVIKIDHLAGDPPPLIALKNNNISSFPGQGDQGDQGDQLIWPEPLGSLLQDAKALQHVASEEIASVSQQMVTAFKTGDSQMVMDCAEILRRWIVSEQVASTATTFTTKGGEIDD